MKILHLLDVDGKSITLRVLREQEYPTHIELEAECIAAFPPSELIGNQFKIVSADYKPYIITGFKTRILGRELHVLVVSGTLSAYKGYAYISYGLPYTEFINRLSVGEKEPFYKKMYESLKLELAVLKSRISECYGEKLDVVESLHEEYSKLLSKYMDFYRRAVGLASPETQVLIESLLAAAQPPTPPTPTPAPAAPRKGILQRVKELLKKLLGRKI